MPALRGFSFYTLLRSYTSHPLDLGVYIGSCGSIPYQAGSSGIIFHPGVSGTRHRAQGGLVSIYIGSPITPYIPTHARAPYQTISSFPSQPMWSWVLTSGNTSLSTDFCCSSHLCNAPVFFSDRLPQDSSHGEGKEFAQLTFQPM